MGYFKCFLCLGQPTYPVAKGKDSWEESHKHYMNHHYKEPANATQDRKANR